MPRSTSPTVAQPGLVGSGPDEQVPPTPQVATPARTSGPAHAAPAETHHKFGLFSSRKTAHELNEEVDRLNTGLAMAQTELAEARAALNELGALDILELDERRRALRDDLVELDADGRRLRSSNAQVLADLDAQQQQERAKAVEEIGKLRRQAETEMAGLQIELDTVRATVSQTQETAILQEIGIYEYRHPLTDAAAYQAELSKLSDQIKAMTRKDGGAITAAVNWTVNGSTAQGKAMVRDFSKLMLRAYNAEADNLVRGLKPYKVSTAIDRLDKTAKTIERLGTTMSIRVTTSYHRLRVKELELTADYLEKVAVEKERAREEAARLRDERKAQAEIEREKIRLEKERTHYLNALAQLEQAGDEEAIARVRDQLAEIEKGIADVDYRAANIRAGYVYVISNLGSFGERVVKIGMTRRLEPRDRIRELSDASVPFNFDTHALFFSNDAVGIEAAMHRTFADRAVNRVNRRREFFFATPAEARDELLKLTGDLLEFTESPEAIEYRQSTYLAPISASV